MVDSIRDCVVDSARLAPLSECLGYHDLDPNIDTPADEWKYGILHPDTLAYSCGRLTLPGLLQEHNHDLDELRLCRQLAEQATQIVGSIEVPGENFNSFEPFYILANRGAEVPLELTPEYIRLLFGGTIYPQVEVIVQPFQEGNLAWDYFVASTDPTEELSYLDSDNLEEIEEFWEERRQRVEVWQRLFNWFASREELHDAAFVMIGDGDPPSDTNRACVFPCLVLAITQAGSLVGICTHAVRT